MKPMTQKESDAINIARLIFIIGVLFIHFPISISAVDGIFISQDQTPVYNCISSRFFLNSTCLEGLFFLSGYLFFKTVTGEFSYNVYKKKIDGRIKSLFIPYVFWNIFWLVYNLIKTWKLQGRVDAEFLRLDSVNDFFSCFWETGYGSHPDFPIAGYTWFLRDLFVFALFSPIYNYCYHNKHLAEGMFAILLISLSCTSIEEWHIPGINAWLYIGGYIAYKGCNLEDIVGKVNWVIVMVLFAVANILFFYIMPAGYTKLLLVITSFIIIMKVSLLVSDWRWLLSLSSTSTYLYVTHIFVLNISRHALARIVHVTNDATMCIYYILNSIVCLCLCIGTYYILKEIKAKRILAIMTGGRG